MVMKQPEVTERTRQRLCRAFWHLYSRQPLEKVTVKQVAELGGYNRATFYLYYGGVRILLGQEEDVLIARRQETMGSGEVNVHGPDDVRVNLTAFLEQTRRDVPYLGGMISMIRLWLADPDPMPLDHLVECIINTFMPDVTTE